MKQHILKYALSILVIVLSSFVILSQDETSTDILTFQASSTAAVGEITTIDLTFEIPETACPSLDTQNQIDVMLVMDVSGSMQGTRLAVAKSAALRFLSILNPESTQVGLVRFANRATALNGLSSDYVPVDNNINNLVAGGATNIAAGLLQAASVLNSNARPGSRRIIQLLSDGESNIGNEVAAANQIRNQGIEIFAVGFGDADATTLRAVASPGNFFIFSQINQGLNEAFNQAGIGIATGNRVAASDITITLTVDTDNFAVISDLTLAGSVEDGTVTWTIPVIYDGQSVQRSVAVVPINEGAFSLGEAEITYTTCLDGDSVTVSSLTAPTLDVGTALTNAQLVDSGVLKTSFGTSSDLGAFDSDRWLLDLEGATIISVVVQGAGSQLVPDVLVNEEIIIFPLYSVRDLDADQRSSIFYVGDIDAAWLYLQSNSREDVGVYVLDINEGATGQTTPLALGADGIIETQTEFEGRLYDIQGNLSDGDYITVLYEFGSIPDIDIISLSDGLVAQPQMGWFTGRDTTSWIFQLRGDAPYRMVVTTDTQYRIAVQSGDSLQTQRGELSVNVPANSSGSDLEMDRWTVELDADQAYIISIPGAAGRGIYFELSQVDEDSRTYVTDNYWNGGYHDEIGPFVLDENATYSLIVTAGRNYSVAINETTLPQSEPQTISSGETVLGETIAGADGIQWTFEGRANQFVRIVLDPSRSDVSWIEMSLATSEGVDIAFSDDDGALVTIGPELLTEDTTYVITVAPRFFLNATFDLTLSLVDVGNATNIVTGRGGNLRSGAGTNFNVVGSVEANETLFAIGATESGDWIRVVTYDGKDGWLFAQILSDPTVVDQLAVVDSAGNVIREAAASSGDTNSDTSSNDTSDETSSDEATEAEFSCTVAAGQTANLRSGPGTNFDRAGTLGANESATVIGQAAGSDGFTWWQLDTGNWIREDVVVETGNCEDAP